MAHGSSPWRHCRRDGSKARRVDGSPGADGETLLARVGARSTVVVSRNPRRLRQPLMAGNRFMRTTASQPIRWVFVTEVEGMTAYERSFEYLHDSDVNFDEGCPNGCIK